MAERPVPGCFWCGEPAVVVRKRQGGRIIRGPWFECELHAYGDDESKIRMQLTDRCVYKLGSEQAANYWQAAVKKSVEAMAARLKNQKAVG